MPRKAKGEFDEDLFRNLIPHLDNKNEHERGTAAVKIFSMCEESGLRFCDACARVFGSGDSGEAAGLRQKVASLEQELAETNRAAEELVDKYEAKTKMPENEPSVREWLRVVWAYPQMRMMTIACIVIARIALYMILSDGWKWGVMANVVTGLIVLWIFLKWCVVESLQRGFGQLFVKVAVFGGFCYGVFVVFTTSGPVAAIAALCLIVAFLASRVVERVASAENALCRIAREWW